MSRAFVIEGDNWNYCKRWLERCMFADEAGGCMVKRCRQHEPDEAPPAPDPKPNTL